MDRQTTHCLSHFHDWKCYLMMTPASDHILVYLMVSILHQTNTCLVTWRTLLSTHHHHGNYQQQTRIDLQICSTIILNGSLQLDRNNQNQKPKWIINKHCIFKNMLLKIIQLTIVKSLYETFSNWTLRCAISIPFPLRIEGFTLLDTEVREAAHWQEQQRSLHSLSNIWSYC